MAPGEQYLPPVESTFALVLRGYDRSQVAQHLRLVAAELRMIAADRDAAVDQAGQLAYQLDSARTETERLKAQLTRMAAPPDTVEGMSERLQWMLRLAQDEVREMQVRAEADAEATRSSAVTEAAELAERNREQAGQLDAEWARAHSEIDSHRADALAEIDRLRAESDERRSALDADSAARRAQADEDFAIALTARRAEAEAEFAVLETRRRAEAARIVDDATADASRVVNEASETARRLVAEARAEVAELRTLRGRISEQLAAARDAFERVAPALAPLPTEDASEPGTRAPVPATPRL